jgi:hypothetical protein
MASRVVGIGLSLLGCSEKLDGSGIDETDSSNRGESSESGDPGESGESDESGESGESSESGIVVGEGGFNESAGDGDGDGDLDLGLGIGCNGRLLIDPRRTLIETNVEALAEITMSGILTRAALSSDLVGDPDFTYARLVDSFTTAESAKLAGGSYCDDTLVDGVPSLGGYPIQCPRAESEQIDDIDSWFAVAAVNRFDLAAADGSDCGEQRLILASAAQGRMLVIFEARIPNPDPSCGIAACRPIVDFWVALSSIDDPVQRNHQLRLAFLDGHPTLTEAGFEPFMSGVNLTFGTGQIRSNSRVDDPWTLREFRFVAEGTRLSVLPTPVTGDSFAALWNDLGPEPQGPDCRQSILDKLETLLVDDTAAMGLMLDPSCFAGESREDFTSNYALALGSGSGTFEAAIAERLVELGSDLTPNQLANRASFASNCMGCHASANGFDLGHGLLAPSSMGFVHVDEFNHESCGDGACFAISPALAQDFLPARLAVLEGFLAQVGCDAQCSDADPDAISLLLEGPATTGLPDASLGVERLLARQRELLSGLAVRTLGGRPRGAH